MSQTKVILFCFINLPLENTWAIHCIKKYCNKNQWWNITSDTCRTPYTVHVHVHDFWSWSSQRKVKKKKKKISRTLTLFLDAIFLSKISKVAGTPKTTGWQLSLGAGSTSREPYTCLVSFLAQPFWLQMMNYCCHYHQ